ncbi:MAG: sporulation protein YunB [Firmicutes bacterium HGW-Firmicutes-1]|jgi:sporulation protein YunB|nr:MAG: sporulation protein YunB [Firmicutes bacterium HGW-Firmicutes-1]
MTSKEVIVMKKKKKAYLIHPFLAKKVIKGRKPRKERNRFKSMFTLILFMAFIVLIVRYIENELMPTVVAMSNMKVSTMSNSIINKAVDETFEEYNASTEGLVTYYYNEKGEVISFGVNTVLINQMNSEIVDKINKQIESFDKEVLSIPIGRLLGESVFSNFGPNINVSILPYGKVTTNYKSSFVATGINQINHRIWIDVEMTIQIVVPLNKTQVEVCQELTLVDRVINGNVPDQYINVPKDEILNIVK